MYNGNKVIIISTLCEEFISLEQSIKISGGRTKTHEENIDKIKSYIRWSLNQKDYQNIIKKSISCVKTMILIYDEVSSIKEKATLVFIAKSIYAIATEEIKLK